MRDFLYMVEKAQQDKSSPLKISFSLPLIIIPNIQYISIPISFSFYLLSSISSIMGWCRKLMMIIFSLLLVTQAKTTTSEPIPQRAPLNPEFIKYQEDVAKGILHPQYTADGHYLGYIPSPVDLFYLKGQKIFQNLVVPMLSFPSTYDLRTYGKVSPVEAQECGDCWIYATYGSLESNELTADKAIFSEEHLDAFNGFDNGCCNGGNFSITQAYLARWSGPVYESDDPYISCNSPSDLSSLPARKHVQEVDWIPQRSNSLDNDNIKLALMNYGAVACCFGWDNAYYNSTTYAYYCDTTAGLAGHCVTLVGWDDNYSSTNFVTPPPGNGAFLIKNSWSTGWGDNGFFHISYYDVNVGGFTLFRMAESTTNFSNIYQYDPLGQTAGYGYGSFTGWFANIFTAVGTEKITAVSFYVAEPNSTYTVAVYLDPTSGPINNSGPVLTNSSTISNPGYQTINLSSSVSVNSSQRFSIVVMLNTPGYYWPIPIESQDSGYSSGATATTGQSYISSNGSSWTDMTLAMPNANVCLKAFSSFTEIFINGYLLDSSGNPLNGSYAYVADWYSGLQIINISNPASPILTGSYDATLSSAHGVAVSGNYAYVADYSSGLQIINISNPASPTLTGSYATPDLAWNVTVSGNYAYVAEGADDIFSGLQIINITNPASPTLAGSYATPSYAYGVAVSGNYAYVADWNSGLEIINISNPTSPTLAGSYATPGAVGVTVSGNSAYMADYNSGLQIINISNPSSPTLAGHYATPSDAESVAVSSTYAYVAEDSGLQIINISNPASPTLAGFYTTSGIWGWGVAVSGNNAYVAAGNLEIINISTASLPTLVGSYATGYAESVAVSVVTARITMSLSGTTSGSTNADSNGYYQFTNLSLGGNYTVTPGETHYTFSPPYQTYNSLTSYQSNQNFTGTISLPAIKDWMLYSTESDYMRHRF